MVASVTGLLSFVEALNSPSWAHESTRTVNMLFLLCLAPFGFTAGCTVFCCTLARPMCAYTGPARQIQGCGGWVSGQSVAPYVALAVCSFPGESRGCGGLGWELSSRGLRWLCCAVKRGPAEQVVRKQEPGLVTAALW